MNCVLTLTVGENFQELGKLTHPTIKAYADRIGADFVVIDKQEISQTPQWEKFKIYDLLNQYERIIYLDSDLIVRDDCPDLFELVPVDKIGLFNESGFTDRTKQMKENGLKAYYNSGVMVISRKHKELFVKPKEEVNDFYEQTYLNTQFAKADVFPLDYKFNRMTCMDTAIGISRLDSFVVHYAGCPNQELMMTLIQKDLKGWTEERKYPQRVHISVSGGLGDQVCAKPAITYLHKILPNVEVNISTHFPILFIDIPGIRVFNQGDFKALDDTPYVTLDAFPDPTTLVFSVISANLCNTVDYISIALLKRILPIEDKRIKLSVSLEGVRKICEVIGIQKLDDLVLIHAGKHWDTKTLPKEYWEGIIDGLVAKGIPVCLIGKTGSPGIIEFGDKKGVFNTVDLLDLESLITLIAYAKVLITNDSAPVHIAGAFDNEIIVFPTVKHPEHILPFREKQSYALIKKLLLDDYETVSFRDGIINVDKMKRDWSEYLVPVDDVINLTTKLYGN
jgi:hypothetical protein